MAEVIVMQFVYTNTAVRTALAGFVKRHTISFSFHLLDTVQALNYYNMWIRVFQCSFQAVCLHYLVNIPCCSSSSVCTASCTHLCCPCSCQEYGLANYSLISVWTSDNRFHITIYNFYKNNYMYNYCNNYFNVAVIINEINYYD